MFSVGSIGAIGRGSARSLDALWRLAGFTPSFDFPFARSRSLVDAVTGQSLITYTQASSGTYVNSDRVITTAASDEPRFDHDPATGESLGLLIEEQRANQQLWSEEANNPAWNILGSSIIVDSDVAIAPNGAQTADKVKEATTTGSHSIEFSGLAFQSGLTYAVSFFAKAVERSRARIAWPVSFPNRLVFVDVNPASYGVISSGGTVTQVIPGNNNWFRVISTSTCTTTTSGSRIGITLVNTGTNVNYTGDGTSGLFIWGVQLEVASFATSYIPTGASTVTRSASLADLISSAIANNIRSFYVEFRSPAVGTSGVVSLNDNTANNRAAVITSGTDPRLVVHSGGIEQANINGGTVTAGARTRVAVRINNNDFAISINGGAVVTDTSGTLPTVDRIMIGRTQAGEFLNSRIARFTGWNQLLSDATLRSLSSQ